MFVRRISLLLALFSLVLSQDAWAHDKEVERTVFLQVDDKGVVVLWGARSAGKRVKLQGAFVDLDRNGKLSDGEKKLLAAGMLQKAMAGVSLKYAGAPLVKPNKFETQLKETVPGADYVEAIGIASYDAKAPAGESTAIELTVEEGYGPVAVQVQTLGERFIGWVNRAIVAQDRKGLAMAIQLKPNETLKVVVVRGEAPKPKEHQGKH